MITSLNGSYSVGKSTLASELQKKLTDTRYTPDLARVYLNRNNLKSDTLTPKQRQEMQLWVAATYIGAMTQAHNSRINTLMDGSLIEVAAYSEGVLSPTQMAAIGRFITKFKDSMLALVILPTIPLQNDNLRHTDEAFRIEIHKRIMDVITSFNIPYQYLVGSTIEERTTEAYNIISKHG